MASHPRPTLSFEEYLEQEERATYKSEYRVGEVFAMAGGTSVHSRLGARAVVLMDRLYGETCNVFNSDQMLYVAAYDESFYPDAMVICGVVEYYQQRTTVVLNPTIAIEVLSPSTRSYDDSFKSMVYRSIPSLTHYLQIDSERIYVQLLSRAGDHWILQDWKGLEGIVSFNGDKSISVAEIYRNILSA